MGKNSKLYIAGVLLLVVAFFSILIFGAVPIPIRDVLLILTGQESGTPYASIIVIETRLPMAIAATCCGAMLSVAGLMMQTIFHNPLAGPSVLGISSGSSLGVALLLLSTAGLGGLGASIWNPVVTIAAALAGGLLTIFILLFFSSVLKSGVTLLIVGIMIGYLCSSGISLLNYFSPADEIRNYLVWGLGSFSSLRMENSIWLLCGSAIAIIPAFTFIKPLNAILLGDRYLESVGFSPRNVRRHIMIITGLLVAVATAFCGPIGFLGLIVPHLCRLMFGSSNHLVLMPACVIYGGVVSLLCALICVIPSASNGVLPINVITPLIGVPVILYLLINRSKLPYFS